MLARIASIKSFGRKSTAFTLVELLVVMAIIGVLAAIGLPAMKGIGAGNDVSAAIRQLMDDLSYARLKAMNERSTVYVVFVSPQILRPATPWGSNEQKEVARHARLQFTSYALFTKRSLGDQPGAERPRFITDWRTLPQGTFIPTNKFDTRFAFGAVRTNTTLFDRPFFFGDTANDAGRANLIPFPQATNKIAPSPIQMAYIAFDFQGRLKRPANAPELHDVIVPIAKGSIIYPQDDPDKLENGNLDPAEVIETPKGNATNNPSIRIDWLTGRARVVRPEKVDYAATF